MASDCPERFNLDFLLWTWKFSNKSRTSLSRFFENFERKKIRVTTTDELSRLLSCVT